MPFFRTMAALMLLALVAASSALAQAFQGRGIVSDDELAPQPASAGALTNVGVSYVLSEEAAGRDLRMQFTLGRRAVGRAGRPLPVGGTGG